MSKGKRPEDLPLDDAALSQPEPPASVTDFLAEIEELLTSGDYAWASDTLSGIAETVEQYQTVTEGQRRAVENVRAARGRSEGRSRRYEGFKRTRW